MTDLLERTYGLRAVRGMFTYRSDDIVKLIYHRSLRLELRDILKLAAAKRIAYHEATTDELATVTQSHHHEGICVWAKPRQLPTTKELLAMLTRQPSASTVLALEHVDNPHNVGSIVKSAATFGISALVWVPTRTVSQLPASTIRSAEGAVENLKIAIASDDELTTLLIELRNRRWTITGTDGGSTQNIWAYRNSATLTKSVVVVGNEATGITENTKTLCDKLLAIPGSGKVESLNVAVATGVVLHTLFSESLQHKVQ